MSILLLIDGAEPPSRIRDDAGVRACHPAYRVPWHLGR